MTRFVKHIILIVLALISSISVAQNTMRKSNKDVYFTVKGSVIDGESFKPIKDVKVEVNGGAYTTSSLSGDFRIEAKKGDELVISHNSFKTVYYTIQDDERVTIEVHPEVQNNFKISKRANKQLFKSLVDSAARYSKTNIDKSINFITQALKESSSLANNAEAYEVLANTYLHFKQYDLAVSNYQISLQNKKNNDVNLMLAKVYFLNKNYNQSLRTYQSINVKKLSNYQKTVLHEGLGDVYLQLQNTEQAIFNYNEGLTLAKKHVITPKITDLNSKIGEAYSSSGNKQQAQGYFSNSLELASEENKTRALKEKIKVADFKNFNQDYDTEIELRKDALDDIADIELDSLIENKSAFTPQKQNYKIGDAYFLKNDYKNAIPYFEKSIEEADKKEDLIVKKDAIKKLSRAFEASGNAEEALKAYKEYTNVVDALYIKKEQEISQAARFSRDIATKQGRITSLEKDRELSQSRYLLNAEQNKRQTLIIYSLLGGLLLLLITAYFMYKYIRQQKLANNLLALKSLRSQMNPHFIFNALNSVNSFIASNDERSANKYLSDFSKLMRSVLENSEDDFILLEKEIELLTLYTQLEHARFKDKFDYNITVNDDVVLTDFLIPPMLLQPYIENAVWHGLRYKKEKGFLGIDISQKTKGQISITITDNGIGREKSKAMKTQNQKKHKSKGLGNIKQRVAILNNMYKDKVNVFIEDFNTHEEDVGTNVIVTIKKD